MSPRDPYTGWELDPDPLAVAPEPEVEPRRGDPGRIGTKPIRTPGPGLGGCWVWPVLVVAVLAIGVHSGSPADPDVAQSAERHLDLDQAVEVAGSSPVVGVNAGASPSGSVGTALVSGWATFYEDPSQLIDHYAAAGPLLRDALGHWRGKVIRVTSGQHSTIVRLADFCACGRRHGLPTLLDLSPEAFRDLAPLSAGIVRVEIELVELPATDALPRNAGDLRMQREVREDGIYR